MPTPDQTPLQPQRINVIEGHLIFHDPALVADMDLRVWLDADANTRLQRRIARDTQERGRSREDVLTRFHEEATPAFEAFMAVHREQADIAFFDESLETSLSTLLRHLPS